MRKIAVLFILSVFLVSCGSSRPTGITQKRNGQNIFSAPETSVARTSPRKQVHLEQVRIADIPSYEEVEEIPEVPEIPELMDDSFFKKLDMIDYAKTYQGTRYKFGGTSRSGMDCSGLVCTVFEKENISLPRSSRDMASKGFSINLKQVEPGDLVFFKTSKRNVINHVGLVVESEDGTIKFIHSTVKAGVIVSSMDENYWKRTFVEARRVI